MQRRFEGEECPVIAIAPTPRTHWRRVLEPMPVVIVRRRVAALQASCDVFAFWRVPERVVARMRFVQLRPTFLHAMRTVQLKQELRVDPPEVARRHVGHKYLSPTKRVTMNKTIGIREAPMRGRNPVGRNGAGRRDRTCNLQPPKLQVAGSRSDGLGNRRSCASRSPQPCGGLLTSEPEYTHGRAVEEWLAEHPEARSEEV
jgi:hypothetical protein